MKVNMNELLKSPSTSFYKILKTEREIKAIRLRLTLAIIEDILKR